MKNNCLLIAMSLNGVIIINKEKDYTSQDAVSVVKGILKIKKAGHTGTLDPMAEGVLPVCIGQATKAASFITADRKSYDAVMRLGIRTDTYDLTGTVTAVSDEIPDEKAITEKVMSFAGSIMQRPPLYSAVHVNGKRAYELARHGESADLPLRAVEIYEIRVNEISLPRVSFSVDCSAGTYVRSLINDIGNALGCGASMEALTRTACGDLTIDRSCTIKELEKLRDEGRVNEALITIPEVFSGLKRFEADDEGLRSKAQNGNPLPLPSGMADGEMLYVNDGSGFFYGIYKADGKRGLLMPEKMFLVEE